ncbi:DUF4331 domain-containing protein [Methylococcus geothermalis]|uniref:DUF4331 domain-containing protein n=1 Tax=Methylococcus geothermalis TaxID=2681310 RepID=A0A858QB83_9GAMM|nr:DUF4331 domain-containing protein [Methylococcus geothermalis]QJD31177.1 DUF4331 domain-containing protein [Methylococcus geothermalis]
MTIRFEFALAACLVGGIGSGAQAASHREAPLIALDPAADLTDVYAFVSYDPANMNRAPQDRRVTFIMNVNPGQNPADGPNYFNFADDVTYRFNLDNDRDGKAGDIVYEFRFKTEDRPIGGKGGLTSPVPYLGNPAISAALPLQGITALDGPGSEGLTRRQTYTVTENRRGRKTVLFRGLVAVPSNAGPATMPDYESLAAQGMYTDAGKGIRVFAGQRAETFYIDLGATFDTLNLRRSPPVLPGTDDGDNVNPFGINRFAGANISTIALEVPISRITSDGQAANDANKYLGLYASTSRQKTRVLRSRGMPRNSGDQVQVARLANPLINELIINTPAKDFWNAQEPEKEVQFQEFYKAPVVAAAFDLVFGSFGVKAPATPRVDLLQVFLKYPGQAVAGNDCGSPCSELLRLDLSVPPTPPLGQRRLGAALGGDPAGFPNGRRPNDDVTDIAIRVVGGADYVAIKAGDGVNFLEGAPGAGLPQGPGNHLGTTATGIASEFPFLPTPYPGRS